MNQVNLFNLPESEVSQEVPMRTYGTVSYDVARKRWRVDCEPQVRARLKRVFPKIWAKANAIELPDNVDAGRDLSWFLERYPMRMSPVDAQRLRERDRQHRQLVDDIGLFLAADYQPKGATLALPLRGYQAVAVDLCRRVSGLLLTDELGVGKTASAIGMLAHADARPALVVTLAHLPRQWQRELDRFLPGMKIHTLAKMTPYDLKGTDGSFPDVILTSYHKLSGWADALAGKVRTVVFDEAHELRRDSSAKYKGAVEIASSADYRIGLTGTPVFNYGGEVFNLVDALKPGALGDWSSFAIEWCAGIEDKTKARIDDTTAFNAYLREQGLMLRRTRKDVGRELPALSNVPFVVDANTDELDRIQGDAANLAKIILAQGGMGLQKMEAASELSWRLRQATGIAKAPFVADFVRLLIEQGESVLLYGWHREVYDIWKARMKDLDPVFFTGTESPKQKQAAQDAFVERRTKLLIMSLRAGAGIDGLQGVCRTVVHGEFDWAHAVHLQATGRVYRDGQPEPVTAYFPYAEIGSDPVIMDVLGVKRGQLEGILDPGADRVIENKTDPEHMRRLAEDYLARHTGGRRRQEEPAA